jgi:5-carboxymethyl-2-hydroxymuconate isomerase
MPHIILEYSSNISLTHNIKEHFFTALHKGFAEWHSSFNPDECKSRSIRHDDYKLGFADQRTVGFIHLTIIILNRPQEVRTLVKEKAAELLKQSFSDYISHLKQVDLTVLIEEFKLEDYSKTRINL